MPIPTKYPGLNACWTSLLVEECIRNGITRFCIAPGSRSTPLTMAIARHPDTEDCIHFDERGLAFYALGQAKESGLPSVIVTTSGTAVANLFPAVIEAAQSDTPLIVVSADRPPELLHRGANQAIDQVGIFGSYPVAELHLPCPNEDESPLLPVQTISDAIHQAKVQRGPVHLNCMFREPLEPDDVETSYTDYLEPLGEWLREAEPMTRNGDPKPELALPDELLTSLDAHPGIVLVGELKTATETQAVRELMGGLKWPFFADISSGLRLSDHEQNMCFHDHLLSHRSFRELLAPKSVLHIGGQLTTRGLNALAKSCDGVPYFKVQTTEKLEDPNHVMTHKIQANIPDFCMKIMSRHAQSCRHPQLDEVCDANHEMVADIRKQLGGESNHDSEDLGSKTELLDNHVVAKIVGALPDRSVVFLGNSLAIRLANEWVLPTQNDIRVITNRGASGIDGLMATACGIDSTTDRSVTAIVGDLSALHDLNSLALLAERQVRLIVLNNHGGGIFRRLPIAKQTDVFATYFETAHTVSFEGAATMFGVPYRVVDSMATLEGVLVQPVTNELIEIDLG